MRTFMVPQAPPVRASALGTVATRAVLFMAFFLVLLVPSTRVRAQTVEGYVVEDETGEPMGTVEVSVLDGDSAVVDSYVTDANGRFVARLPSGGEFLLQASRLGYVPSTSEVFALSDGQAALAELRMQLDPVLLDPLNTVVERQNLVLANMGFYERRDMGAAQVRTPEDLEARPPQDIRDLLRGMNGLRVVQPPGSFQIDVLSNRRSSMCRPSVMIDNRIIQRGGTENLGWYQDVDVRTIVALEVYAGQAGLPERVAGPVSPCGAIVLWTKGYVGG